MKPEINPFHELYVTEMVSPEEFVLLFSPFLVRHAQLLFQPGNIALIGSQGSGKSMLLSLLKPQVRDAYFRSGKEFPVPKPLQGFIGAGININRSGAINIGQRPLSKDPDQDARLFPLYFSDFVNYFIVRDILRSIEFVIEHPDAFLKMLSPAKADMFAKALAKEPCWFGYLDSVRTFQDLIARLDARIILYRSFHQFNIEQLPDEMDRSKTAIGEPISRTASCLREAKFLSPKTHLLIRIDELNILHEADQLRRGLGQEYRRVINKALANRDPLVFYKIGTRTYGWQNNLTVFGTTASLEKDRDYKVLDLDKKLRREENQKTWIFPGFAEDVFARRLRNSSLELGTSTNAFREVMGTGFTPESAAQLYAKGSDSKKALQIEEGWPDVWRHYLEKLYGQSRLSAILAAAWARQGRDRGEDRLSFPPPADKKPWEKEYWKKERIGQALLQLSGHCGQRIMWCGADDILALSGGNILAFVSLCQHIWDSFLQSERGKPEEEQKDPLCDRIDETVQAAGIQAASAYWYGKIPERPGGNDRQRFIDVLGRLFQKKLYGDEAMSSPGHNGFSLPNEERVVVCAGPRAVAMRFLNDAVEHSDLFGISHTTKEKSRKQRFKYYLNPIFSPCFKIPESHVKEPMYVHIGEVMEWMKQANIPLDIEGGSWQLPLFPQDLIQDAGK